MNLVDVHAHLDMPPVIDHIEEVVSRAKAAGVGVIIANGVNPSSNRMVLDLAKKYDIIKPALGLYPTDTHHLSLEEIQQEIDFIASQSNIIAFGEVGLDKKWSEEDKKRADELFEHQKKAFTLCIKKSMELDIPLIIHSRKAELEVIELLEELGAKKVVMHCFMGKKKYVERIQKNKWYFSIPCIVSKLNQLQYMVQTTPLSRLLLETDAPFLGVDVDSFNESARIRESVEIIARIKGLTVQETADQLFMNYQRLFQ